MAKDHSENQFICKLQFHCYALQSLQRETHSDTVEIRQIESTRKCDFDSHKRNENDTESQLLSSGKIRILHVKNMTFTQKRQQRQQQFNLYFHKTNEKISSQIRDPVNILSTNTERSNTCTITSVCLLSDQCFASVDQPLAITRAIASIIFSIMIISCFGATKTNTKLHSNQILIHTNCSFALHLKMIIYFYAGIQVISIRLFDKCGIAPNPLVYCHRLFSLNVQTKTILLYDNNETNWKCMCREPSNIVRSDYNKLTNIRVNRLQLLLKSWAYHRMKHENNPFFEMNLIVIVLVISATKCEWIHNCM